MKLSRSINNYRVQKQIIDKNDPRFEIIDEYCIKSKNLYNVALLELIMRLEYQEFPKKLEFRNIIRKFPEFHSINTRISNYIVFQAHDVVYSYIQAMKQYKKDAKKFTGEPSLPKLKRHESQRNRITLDKETFSVKKTNINNNKIYIRALNIHIDVNSNHEVKQISIYKKRNRYVISIIRNEPILVNQNIQYLNSDYYLSIDLGVKNIMAITSNKPGFHPILVRNNYLLKIIDKHINSGKIRKSINSWINFENRKQDIFYKLSHFIKKICLNNNIGNIVIGNNFDWQRHSKFKNLNRISYSSLINKIENLCQLNKINVKTREESYTSKCSFLDLEDIKKQNTYLGTRPKRGLFISAEGHIMNADINGSYNILRKEIGDRWVKLDFGNNNQRSNASPGQNQVNLRVCHKDYTANPTIISIGQLVDIRHKSLKI